MSFKKNLLFVLEESLLTLLMTVSLTTIRYRLQIIDTSIIMYVDDFIKQHNLLLLYKPCKISFADLNNLDVVVVIVRIIPVNIWEYRGIKFKYLRWALRTVLVCYGWTYTHTHRLTGTITVNNLKLLGTIRTALHE